MYRFFVLVDAGNLVKRLVFSFLALGVERLWFGAGSWVERLVFGVGCLAYRVWGSRLRGLGFKI